MKLTQLLSSNGISLNDLEFICSYEGFAYIKTLKCKNTNECLEKINYKFTPKGVLINFRIKEDFPLIDIEKIMNKIYEIAHEDADIIFNTSIDNNLKGLEVNLVFTGIEGD